MSVCYQSSANVAHFYTIKRYIGIFLAFNLWVFDKSFHSKAMAGEKANNYANEDLHVLIATGFSPFEYHVEEVGHGHNVT